MKFKVGQKVTFNNEIGEVVKDKGWYSTFVGKGSQYRVKFQDNWQLSFHGDEIRELTNTEKDFLISKKAYNSIRN